MQITFDIPNENVQNALENFLYVNPKPEEFTNKEWLEKKIMDYLREEVRHGKVHRIRDESLVSIEKDKDIFEVE